VTTALFVFILGACHPETKDAAPSDTGASDTGTEVVEPLNPIEEIPESDLPQGVEPCREPALGRVISVTDGDTITVQTDRGYETVRLIGIDTPEVDHSGPDDECYGEEAKAFLSAMVKGEHVWLTFDAECEDHFERTLAYVHTSVEENGFIQRLLLRDGWASAYAVNPNVSFRTLFESDQSEAQAAGNGLWGSCR
jgi:endonuclease YncB( thermonuclease family)